jgi:DNA mismatch repair protein MutS2
MRAAQAKSRQILQRIIASPSYGKILQESIITQRDGRFVVPVKAEHRGDLPGLVHDVSASGATLFVEPMGVVQANNELIELEAREKKEIERILAELSADAASHKDDIGWDYDALVRLDAIFARGQLSYKLDAARPEIRRSGGVSLRRARHPLLDQTRAVPIDLTLGDTFDTLVITGPNTGGKTVSLKTLGLLCLMAQCGLHIPAGDRSAVPVFDARCWRMWGTSRASNRVYPLFRHIWSISCIFCRRPTGTAWCSSTSWAPAPTPWRARRWPWPLSSGCGAAGRWWPPPPTMRSSRPSP